jgi:hypothetical protein
MSLFIVIKAAASLYQLNKLNEAQPLVISLEEVSSLLSPA